MAKISDVNVRREKIRQLKEKVTEEYAQFVDVYREQIANINNDKWEMSLHVLNTLYWLNTYFRENSFMQYDEKCERQDYIRYILSDKTIDMMIDADCNICRKFLNIVALDNAWMCSTQFMNDAFFENNFFTVLETVVYNRKRGINETLDRRYKTSSR